MPLFGSKNTHPTPATHNAPPPQRVSNSSVESPRRGFFSRHRSSSVSSLSSDEMRRSNAHNNRSSTGGSGGLFHRKSNAHHDPAYATNGHAHTNGGGIFHRNQEDPSISNARQRVAAAEAAEREADKALHQSRLAVKEARDHVALLEREAAEEARLARIKQSQAADISRRAKPLGRHGKFY